jgi:hypothetical protein
MISQIPGPIELDPELWEKDPVLKAVFIGSDEFSQWLHSCRSLRDAFEQTDAAELFGLLVAEYKEKTSFGYEMNGDILQRDVRLQSVYFEDPRILVPAPDLEIARQELQHRILVLLFTHELDEIADLKSWKEELQKQKDLLAFELWGNEKPESEKAIPSGVDKADEAKKVLSDLDQKIEQIGNNLDTPEGHLAHAVRILTELEQHLRMDRFMIRLNSLGIKVKASSSEIPTYSGGLGILSGDTLKSLADLSVPAVGITLLYTKGYFHQEIDDQGNQIEVPVEWNPAMFL